MVGIVRHTSRTNIVTRGGRLWSKPPGPGIPRPSESRSPSSSSRVLSLGCRGRMIRPPRSRLRRARMPRPPALTSLPPRPGLHQPHLQLRPRRLRQGRRRRSPRPSRTTSRRLPPPRKNRTPTAARNAPARKAPPMAAVRPDRAPPRQGLPLPSGRSPRALPFSPPASSAASLHWPPPGCCNMPAFSERPRRWRARCRNPARSKQT